MQASVWIVGAGVVGLSAAVHLARAHGIAVGIVERDATYARASSALSASSIRQQFSQPVNIRLSQASLAMLRDLPSWLGAAAAGMDVRLVEHGYLYLAATETGAATLRTQHGRQADEGVATALLEPSDLAARFPALRTDDLRLGSLGLRGEGWFDAWTLLQAMRAGARDAGVVFASGEVTAVVERGGRIRGLRLADGTLLEADQAVIAAGAWSARLLDPFAPDGRAVPIRPRKRDVFVFDADPVWAAGPLVIDPSGLWFRPEGTPHDGGRRQRHLCGGPPRNTDPDEPPLDAIDHGLFDEVLWPALAHRVPAFEAVRLQRAWAGYYEMNTFDHNAFVGPWPGVEGLWAACGFSGHGIQQSPAVGRQLAARLATGAWADPGLGMEALSPERWWRDQPLVESNVI